MTIKPIQGARWKRGFGITAILGLELKDGDPIQVTFEKP